MTSDPSMHGSINNGRAALPVTVAGSRLELLPDRAVFWPQARTLLVADVHLGKGAALRRAGIAVPSGGSRDDFARLDRLIRHHRPERLLVLGDLFHARLEADDPLLASFAAFRARHRAMAMAAIRGNHDRKTRRPPALELEWHDALVEGPFVFAHEPVADPRGYVLAGHLHPVLKLRGRGDAARLPVFWFSAAVGVLPSFGGFTGGYAVTPQAGDRCFAVTPDGLAALQSVHSSETSPCTT